MLRLIIFMVMVFMGIVAGNAQDLPPQLYGAWLNEDNETLIIKPDDSFVRIDKQSDTLASGKIVMKDEKLHIINDYTDTEYDLLYTVNPYLFVVTQPYNNNRAWLFSKLD